MNVDCFVHLQVRLIQVVVPVRVRVSWELPAAVAKAQSLLVVDKSRMARPSRNVIPSTTRAGNALAPPGRKCIARNGSLASSGHQLTSKQNEKKARLQEP